MNEEVVVNIRALAFGGAGVGEVVAQSGGATDLLGITAFVPFTAPGERVRAQVTQRKDRYIHAQLAQVEERSPERIEARCALFRSCGGCELQHLDYAAQLRHKLEMIRSALRAAKLSGPVIDAVRPIVAGEDYGYRRRVTLHVSQTGSVGFYREASRSVVPATECPVVVPVLQESLKGVQDLGRAIQGKVSSIVLEADDTGVVAVLKSPYDLGTSEIRAILGEARKQFQSALLLLGDREVDGFGRRILELPLNEKRTLTLRVPAGYFSQVNSRINLELVQLSLGQAGNVHGKKVFDLYAGAGNFALPLARAGARVTAVECDKRLVSLGRENAARYSLEKNLSIVDSSVERFIASLDRKETADLLIADPPRSGLGPLAAKLPRAAELQLISCHMPSFVRDTKALTELGWQVRIVQPFDMFAQTSYTEILTVFTRE